MGMFKKAKRSAAKMRVAVFGPSGAGKTLSALIMAAGMAKKINESRGLPGFAKVAVIDTERESASLYEGHQSLPKGFDYDVACIEAPFHPRKYTEYIKGALKDGYDIVLVDSLTHAWTGEGGMLDQQNKFDNKFTAWKSISKDHSRLVDALVQTDIHVIATCRTKVEYVLEKDDVSGKTRVEKKGMAPVFRDGIEYEFTLCLDLDVDHVACPSKDRTSLFDTPYGKLTEVVTAATGEKLVTWLLEGGTPEIPEEEVTETKEVVLTESNEKEESSTSNDEVVLKTETKVEVSGKEDEFQL